MRDSDESANQFMDGAFSSGAKTAHEFEVTAYGVKPLPTTSEWSRALGTCPYGKSADLRNTPKGQVTVLDLAAALKEGAWGELPASSSSNGDDDDAYGGRSNDLRGFWSGFEATGKDGISYGILVPFFDGVAYSGLAARVRNILRPNAQIVACIHDKSLERDGETVLVFSEGVLTHHPPSFFFFNVVFLFFSLFFSNVSFLSWLREFTLSLLLLPRWTSTRSTRLPTKTAAGAQ